MGRCAARRIALLGLAFKANTDDMREASSLVLSARLLAEGAEVVAYDPVAGENAARLLDPRVELAGTVLEAVRGADALVIVTEWGEFRSVASPAVRDAMAQPLIVDGRNLLDPAAVRAVGLHLRVCRATRGGRGHRVIAVLLVGGQGTRLRPLTDWVPKSMLPVANRPFLEHQLEHLERHGITRVILACGYLPDAIRAHFGDRLDYVVEDRRWAPAAPSASRPGRSTETFVVCNGDVLTDLDLCALIAFHRDARRRATIALHAVDDPSRYGLVRTGGRRRGAGLPGEALADEIDDEHDQRRHLRAGAGRADLIEPDVMVSVEREVFPRLIGEGLYARRRRAVWIDIGTPASYLEANLRAMPDGRPDRSLGRRRGRRATVPRIRGRAGCARSRPARAFTARCSCRGRGSGGRCVEDRVVGRKEIVW